MTGDGKAVKKLANFSVEDKRRILTYTKCPGKVLLERKERQLLTGLKAVLSSADMAGLLRFPWPASGVAE
jgi:hypothetical protein